MNDLEKKTKVPLCASVTSNYLCPVKSKKRPFKSRNQCTKNQKSLYSYLNFQREGTMERNVI